MDNEIKEMEFEGNGSSGKIYVIKSLKRLEEKQTDLEKAQHESEIDKQKNITELQTKIKMSSAIVSIIVAVVVGLVINIASAFFIYKGLDDKPMNSPYTIEQNLNDEDN